MNPHPMSLTMREWRAYFAAPVPLAVMGAVALVLAILGPFGTDTALRPLPRFGYWAAMVSATYGAGLFANLFGCQFVPRRWGVPAQVVVLGLATGLCVTPVVFALNAAAFSLVPSWAELPGHIIRYFGIAMAVTLVFQLLSPIGAPPPERPDAPPLLERLPLDKRGALLALSAEDHYTRIRTSAGEALVLLRLADAIREAAPTEGLRVHRSHWVALAAVSSASRKGDGARVVLRDGTELPVSRANVAALREAGLLPK